MKLSPQSRNEGLMVCSYLLHSCTSLSATPGVWCVYTRHSRVVSVQVFPGISSEISIEWCFMVVNSIQSVEQRPAPWGRKQRWVVPELGLVKGHWILEGHTADNDAIPYTICSTWFSQYFEFDVAYRRLAYDHTIAHNQVRALFSLGARTHL